MRAALRGLAFALPLWAFIFRSRRGNFWVRMTLGAGSLGLYALRARPEMRRDRPKGKDVATGAISAGILYLIFQLGDRLSRRIMPTGEEDIQAVYRLRTLAPKPLIAAALVAVIGPSEELFWRGLVQHALMQRYGRPRGTALSAAAYGGTHLVTGNLTLTGAATVAGAYWGAEYALDERLAPLLASHILWDLWIFLVAPTPAGRQGG
jgi:membrane protease YdiL (CAAX protease family)